MRDGAENHWKDQAERTKELEKFRWEKQIGISETRKRSNGYSKNKTQLRRGTTHKKRIDKRQYK